MKTKEINENNALIAEFMGAVRDASNCGNDDDFMLRGERGFIYIKDLKYHFLWDWIMPVVQVIERLGYIVEIKLRSTLIIGSNSIINPPFGYGEECSKIEHVYRAVVDFIKWYNKNESKEN